MAEIHWFSSSAGTVDAFVQRLLAREGTLVTNDPIPHPPGDQVLVNLDDPDRVRIRRYASPTQAPSPILQLDFEPGQEGVRVRCEVLRADAPFSAAEREPLDDLGDPEPFEALDILDPFNALGERIAFLTIRGLIDLIRRLWLGAGWVSDRIFGAWRHRRGMAMHGGRLIALVGDIAEHDGRVDGVGDSEPHPTGAHPKRTTIG